METKRILLIAVWVLSLVVAGQWGARAQSQIASPVTGDDFGFQVVGEHEGSLVGILTIRVNGQWRSVNLASRAESSGGRVVPIR